MTQDTRQEALDVEVTTHGRLPGADEYARAKIAALPRLAHRPVLSARVTLTRHGDLAVARPVVAQANLDVTGRVIRAHAEAGTAREAIDLLDARLRRQLAHIGKHWETWHETRNKPRGRENEVKPEIVAHKSFSAHRCTVDEAERELGLLDYDFHLFTESGSGQDAVLYRAEPAGFRLALLAPPGELAAHELPVTTSDQPAPLLTAVEATERLDLLGLPFLFYLDADRGRGAVVYHRTDGDHGLITPADET